MEKISTKLMLGFFVALLGLGACEKSEGPLNGGSEEEEHTGNTSGEVSESLHISFETPDWKRTIDCSHLDLNPSEAVAENVYYVYATSPSTNNTFFLSYPEKAADLEREGNLKKYPVSEYDTNPAPFQFSMRLPENEKVITDYTKGRLVSMAGSSDTEYTEITGIKKVGTSGTYTVFEIKGRYAFKGQIVTGGTFTDDTKPVTGTFHLKIKALN